MKQLPLPYPVAKSRDPISSFKAGEDFHKSGRAESHSERIMNALRKRNGSIGKKIAQETKLTFVQVARRLSELRAMGKVKNCNHCRLNLYRCKGGDCAYLRYQNNEILWWIK